MACLRRNIFPIAWWFRFSCYFLLLRRTLPLSPWLSSTPSDDIAARVTDSRAPRLCAMICVTLTLYCVAEHEADDVMRIRPMIMPARFSRAACCAAEAARAMRLMITRRRQYHIEWNTRFHYSLLLCFSFADFAFHSYFTAFDADWELPCRFLRFSIFRCHFLALLIRCLFFSAIFDIWCFRHCCCFYFFSIYRFAFIDAIFADRRFDASAASPLYADVLRAFWCSFSSPSMYFRRCCGSRRRAATTLFTDATLITFAFAFDAIRFFAIFFADIIVWCLYFHIDATILLDARRTLFFWWFIFRFMTAILFHDDLFLFCFAILISRSRLFRCILPFTFLIFLMPRFAAAFFWCLFAWFFFAMPHFRYWLRHLPPADWLIDYAWLCWCSSWWLFHFCCFVDFDFHVWALRHDARAITFHAAYIFFFIFIFLAIDYISSPRFYVWWCAPRFHAMRHTPALIFRCIFDFDDAFLLCFSPLILSFSFLLIDALWCYFFYFYWCPIMSLIYFSIHWFFADFIIFIIFPCFSLLWLSLFSFLMIFDYAFFALFSRFMMRLIFSSISPLFFLPLFALMIISFHAAFWFFFRFSAAFSAMLIDFFLIFLCIRFFMHVFSWLFSLFRFCFSFFFTIFAHFRRRLRHAAFHCLYDAYLLFHFICHWLLIFIFYYCHCHFLLPIWYACWFIYFFMMHFAFDCLFVCDYRIAAVAYFRFSDAIADALRAILIIASLSFAIFSARFRAIDAAFFFHYVHCFIDFRRCFLFCRFLTRRHARRLLLCFAIRRFFFFFDFHFRCCLFFFDFAMPMPRHFHADALIGARRAIYGFWFMSLLWCFDMLRFFAICHLMISARRYFDAGWCRFLPLILFLSCRRRAFPFIFAFSLVFAFIDFRYHYYADALFCFSPWVAAWCWWFFFFFFFFRLIFHDAMILTRFFDVLSFFLAYSSLWFWFSPWFCFDACRLSFSLLLAIRFAYLPPLIFLRLFSLFYFRRFFCHCCYFLHMMPLMLPYDFIAWRLSRYLYFRHYFSFDADGFNTAYAHWYAATLRFADFDCRLSHFAFYDTLSFSFADAAMLFSFRCHSMFDFFFRDYFVWWFIWFSPCLPAAAATLIHCHAAYLSPCCSCLMPMLILRWYAPDDWFASWYADCARCVMMLPMFCRCRVTIIEMRAITPFDTLSPYVCAMTLLSSMICCLSILLMAAATPWLMLIDFSPFASSFRLSLWLLPIIFAHFFRHASPFILPCFAYDFRFSFDDFFFLASMHFFALFADFDADFLRFYAAYADVYHWSRFRLSFSRFLFCFYFFALLMIFIAIIAFASMPLFRFWFSFRFLIISRDDFRFFFA